MNEESKTQLRLAEIALREAMSKFKLALHNSAQSNALLAMNCCELIAETKSVQEKTLQIIGCI